MPAFGIHEIDPSKASPAVEAGLAVGEDALVYPQASIPLQIAPEERSHVLLRSGQHRRPVSGLMVPPLDVDVGPIEDLQAFGGRLASAVSEGLHLVGFAFGGRGDRQGTGQSVADVQLVERIHIAGLALVPGVGGFLDPMSVYGEDLQVVQLGKAFEHVDARKPRRGQLVELSGAFLDHGGSAARSQSLEESRNADIYIVELGGVLDMLPAAAAGHDHAQASCHQKVLVA